MILSCGLDEKTRVDVRLIITYIHLHPSLADSPSTSQGHVGHPMPGVEVRLLAESDKDVTSQLGEPGEIQVRGPNVFTGYWEDEAVTEKEHCVDEQGRRWFKTGDIGLRDTDEEGGFRVLGRNSVDIIKVRPSASLHLGLLS